MRAIKIDMASYDTSHKLWPYKLYPTVSEKIAVKLVFFDSLLNKMIEKKTEF